MIDIRSFDPTDREAVGTLIAEHLEPGHPILRPDLFLWQFQGFGPHDDYRSFKLLFVDGVLEGFRGGMGIVAQVPRSDGTARIVPGCAMAMWLISPAFRGRGLGQQLLEAVVAEAPVVLGLGSNDLSVPIYRRNDWSSLDALHQWFRPLEPEGFLDLAFGPWRMDDVARWSDAGRHLGPAEPTTPDPEALEALWRATGEGEAIFGLHRNAAFWTWRYLSHPEFQYHFFGDPDDDGVVVTRIEECRPTGPGGPARRALRVLEVLPRSIRAWRGEGDEKATSLLGRVLNWARDEGCVAVDHRNSTRRSRRVLLDAGFEEHQHEHPDDEGRGFAGLLNPFRAAPEPINAHWHITVEPGDRTAISDDDVYLVKSDGDLDRPNDRPALKS